MSVHLADKIVAAIVEDMTSRSGLQNEWDALDPGIQNEIRLTWAEIVVKELTDSLNEFSQRGQ